MPTETSSGSALRDGLFRAPLQWQAALVGTLLQTQLRHLQALANLQKSLAAVGQDQWDGWVCRFAGGVPLDG